MGFGVHTFQGNVCWGVFIFLKSLRETKTRNCGIQNLWNLNLGGGFKHFYFHPEPWGRFPIFDEFIFFHWVETQPLTKQLWNRFISPKVLCVLQVEVSRVFPPANVRRGERLFHPTAVGLQTLGTNPGLGT